MKVRIGADELADLFLFEALPAGDRDWLAARGEVRAYEAGATICREGAPATELFVLLTGELVMSRLSNGEDFVLNRTSHRGSVGGAIRSYATADATYTHSLVAQRMCSLFVLAAADFGEFLRTRFPMAVHLLDGMYFGERNSESTIREREHLARLGKLSANLAHELNNPATATVRGASQLRESTAAQRDTLRLLAGRDLATTTLTRLLTIQQAALDRAAGTSPEHRTALQEADLEDTLADRLEELGLAAAHDLAPVFVSAGLGTDWTDGIAAEVGTAAAGEVLTWLGRSIEGESLLDQISEAGHRISRLVGAVKQYSAMDTASWQQLDLHLGLDSTVVMLSHRLGGVKVVRDYDRSLPRVPAYAAELNQVWTSLIENAADAMCGSGRLVLRTRDCGDTVVVEIGDDGAGIPEHVQSRVFDAFFSTKPVGRGSGLGLDDARRIVTTRHRGTIAFTTGPGGTVFEVRLPVAGQPTDAQPSPAR
jgi:signal transduction histidine kinase